MRVRKGSTYVFHPGGWDMLLSSACDATPGQCVRVVQLPGSPPPNTMGHCHIVDAETGTFLGMCDTRSLTRRPLVS